MARLAEARSAKAAGLPSRIESGRRDNRSVGLQADLSEPFVTPQSTEHRSSRRRFLQVGAAAVGGALLPATCLAEAFGEDGRISTTDLGGATLLQGAGCNVVAMPGTDFPGGALMIDGGLAANADALLAAVRNATHASRIHTLINTHWHPEQTGANEAVGRSGGVIFAHEKTKVYLSNAVYSVTFKGRRPALPPAARPTRTTRAVTARWSSPASRSTTATCRPLTRTRISTFICRR